MSGGAPNSRTATLTPAFAGAFRALPTLAVRVPAATYAGSAR